MCSKIICSKRGTRISTAANLAVIIVDLDHFKAINDTYGHPTGDEVLHVAARLLAGSVRSSDLVARYGGEEFVVVASDCQPAIAISLADVRTRLAEQPVFACGNQIKITASVGIALTDHTEQGSAADLLRQADEASTEQSIREETWSACTTNPG